jgi:hypothetical protein
VTAGEAFADDLRSEAEVGGAMSAAKVRYMTIKVIAGGGGPIIKARALVRGGRAGGVGARLAAAEGN